MTLQEASCRGLLANAAKRLRAAGIENARSEALSLLARTLSIDKADVLAHPEREVTTRDEARFMTLVDRRARREPFAYVVGSREFYGLELAVDSRVLVPRPETEILVDEALAILNRRARTADAPALVVDVGTGSGAIAFAVASRDATARVVGADVSTGALQVADANRRRLGLAQRVGLVRGDLLSWLRGPTDLILANLPYIPSKRVRGLMPEVSQFEPHLALDGGQDGMDLVRRLVFQAAGFLRPGGSILLELDPEQFEPIRAVGHGMRAHVVLDLAGDERVLRLERMP